MTTILILALCFGPVLACLIALARDAAKDTTPKT